MDDQAGFRPGFSTTDHLFALTILSEKANEHKLPLWIATLDFQKAFDSVSHEAIWKALKEQGIELVYIEMLQRLYEGQEAKVKTDASSNWFMIQRGTKQGDPISAIIFNAVVEHFMKILKTKWGKKKFGVTQTTTS